jgi:transketolase
MTADETDPATGTRSTRPEAPAEAASDAPTGNPSQPHPALPEGMGDLDRRAIDTVRVLAMDAVQKAGNGHPGTAMSMAPTAYLLFQKWLRHDPGDPNWAGRDRFVLSMGHSSLTLYIQLFLSGYGLELSDLKALRTWGSQTPGHPEVNHTPGVETTTGPLGQGVGNAVGMAMAARRERGLLDPDAPEGESVFDHTVWTFASDGDLEEGVSGEASSLAGTQELGNLVLVYDANRISIEDDTSIAFTEDVGKRYKAYGWHVQHVDDGEDLVAVDRALATAQAETGRPSLIVLRTIIGWPSPNKQNTGAAHGSALGEDGSARPRTSSASTPARPSTSPRKCSSTPARSPSGAGRRTPSGSSASTRGGPATPTAPHCWSGCPPAHCRRAGRTACRPGTPTRRAWPPGRPPARSSPPVPGPARAVGRFGRPG